MNSKRRLPNYSKTSLTQKEILIRIVYEGKTIREAANIAGINENTARGIVIAYRRDGDFMERIRGGNNKTKLTETVLKMIENLVERNPSYTLKQIKDVLLGNNIMLSITSIYNGLLKLGVTLKKCHIELDKVNCGSSITKRQEYATNFVSNAPQDMAKCIFVDESGFNMHLHRTQARSKKGTRAKIVLPTIRGRNITLIASMHSNGILYFRIIDNSTCNAKKFCSFVQELIALLRQDEEMNGAWIILDNAQIHKTSELRQIIDQSPYELRFLSPYSYMLNPIENVFSKVKAGVRRTICECTTDRSLVCIMEENIATVTEQDCKNYVMNMTRSLTIAASGHPMPL